MSISPRYGVQRVKSESRPCVFPALPAFSCHPQESGCSLAHFGADSPSNHICPPSLFSSVHPHPLLPPLPPLPPLLHSALSSYSLLTLLLLLLSSALTLFLCSAASLLFTPYPNSASSFQRDASPLVSSPLTTTTHNTVHFKHLNFPFHHFLYIQCTPRTTHKPCPLTQPQSNTPPDSFRPSSSLPTFTHHQSHPPPSDSLAAHAVLGPALKILSRRPRSTLFTRLTPSPSISTSHSPHHRHVALQHTPSQAVHSNTLQLREAARRR